MQSTKPATRTALVVCVLALAVAAPRWLRSGCSELQPNPPRRFLSLPKRDSKVLRPYRLLFRSPLRRKCLAQRMLLSRCRSLDDDGPDAAETSRRGIVFLLHSLRPHGRVFPCSGAKKNIPHVVKGKLRQRLSSAGHQLAAASAW